MNLGKRVAAIEAKATGGGIAVIPIPHDAGDREQDACLAAWCAEQARPAPALAVLIRKFSTEPANAA